MQLCDFFPQSRHLALSSSRKFVLNEVRPGHAEHVRDLHQRSEARQPRLAVRGDTLLPPLNRPEVDAPSEVLAYGVREVLVSLVAGLLPGRFDALADLLGGECHDKESRKVRTFCRRYNLTSSCHGIWCHDNTMTEIAATSSLGPRLKTAREAAGFTVARLARELEVDPRTVAGWQAGRSTPTVERLLEIADLLGQSPSYFLEQAA